MHDNTTTEPLTLALDQHEPRLGDHVFTAPSSVLIGQVQLGDHSSVWYGAVLRADTEAITIGARTNIQDGCVLHADPGYPARIGEGVTVGHRAVLHGCDVGDHSLIGIGAVVLNGASIGAESLVAAGAVVLENTDIPPGSLVAGTPARVRRELTDDERAGLRSAAQRYVDLAARHRGALRSGAEATD